MNISIPVSDTMEIIDQTVISPLVSKCKIKVCYIGTDPNRNGTVITKEVATEMGRQLPGSPIVGYYNQEAKDFEGHNKEIVFNEDDSMSLVDTTKPYGFVAPDAKIWFQKFLDNNVEHEYLCTEGYLWTGAYPESKRIIDNGNNQSMELTQTSGTWANDDNSGKRIFIYNRALIEKLCILGCEYEPCFEGASITSDQFTLDRSEFDDFRTQMFSLISQIQETINDKGGSIQVMDDNNTFKKNNDEEEEKKQPETPDQESKEEEKPAENAPEKEDDEKKSKYSTEELEQKLHDLGEQYAALDAKYNALLAEKETLNNNFSALNAEIEGLRSFKINTEKEQKQAMIDSFYMLSDEDKNDVVTNMDNYSLDDIEAKLSVICVRNKLNLSDTNGEDNAPNLFSLNNTVSDDAPEWIKALRQNNNN